MSRPLSRRHLVPGGLLAGLALTGTALSLGAGPHRLTPVSEPTTVSQAAVAPSPLAAPVRVARASRGAARTSLVRYVHREVRVGRTFSGYASWYGGSFQGRRTASGERFDTTELTAASRTLAFGTRLRVCRRSRCVVVRINDRGPYVSSRVLDLSQAARDRLGFSGVARVTATPVATRRVAVRRPVTPPPAPSASAAPVVRPVLAAQSGPVPPRRAPASMLTAGMLLVAASLSLWLWGRRAS
ncbi:MAG TPA: septal ring lytic transglycosylase RlpA family protein [Mycobacteriales bacterium]|jgi:rare lipoprotein A (peptidoglycan hydrolase)|nr:septal ring lytic transglycosylase RlpA family protein [Mycobacteriales bacterium]